MSQTEVDFVSVTELTGDSVTRQQVESVCHRYHWAAQYCTGKDVLEIACGSGPGLGYLASKAASLVAGDITESLVARVRQHYGDRLTVSVMDAQKLSFDDASLDVVILFEALYYLPDADAFAAECRRVLRPNGHLLITTANRDAPDFNPSPFSRTYRGVVLLGRLLEAHGFSTKFFGYWTYETGSIYQRLLVSAKKLAVGMGLMPKTMHGKKFLKRLVFGSLVEMPNEITEDMCAAYRAPEPIEAGVPDQRHRVIYCAARRR